MIKDIIMKNVATFDSKGTKLEDCKKINFIYGNNGSGKTTVSNFLANLQNKEINEKYKECSITNEDN